MILRPSFIDFSQTLTMTIDPRAHRPPWNLAVPRLRARLQSQHRPQDQPPGALGRIEQLAVQLGVVLGHRAARDQRAADGGVRGRPWPAARGVSAYPSDVTWQMVENFLVRRRP